MKEIAPKLASDIVFASFGATSFKINFSAAAMRYLPKRKPFLSKTKIISKKSKKIRKNRRFFANKRLTT